MWWKEEKETVHQIPESDNVRAYQKDPLSDDVYQHPEILSPAGWLEVRLLPINNNSQVLTELKELLLMMKKEGKWVCNHQPYHSGSEGAGSPSCESTPNQVEHSGEDLGSWRKAETQNLELVDLAGKSNPQVRLGVQVNQNLEVCILAGDWKHDIPLRIDPRTDDTIFIWKLVQGDKTIPGRHVDHRMLPTCRLLYGKKTGVEPQIRTVYQF